MQAQKLHLPLHHRRRSFSSSLAASSSSTDPFSLVVSSLLVEPSSRSLALMLSDSSALLYPPFLLPLPPASFPPPTPVPPVSTSACFLRLQPRPRVLFLSAASHGASVLLRAWILSSGGQRFTPARLSYKRDRPKPGIILDLPHGFSVTLAASVNVFVLHSPAAARIWVCAARLVGEAGDGDQEPAVEVMKCAAIECTSPIFSIHVSPGFLLLGELSGVRVFPLRTLVKGRAGGGKDSSRRRHEDRKQGLSGGPLGWRGRKLPNGLVVDVLGVTSHRSSARSESSGCLCDSKGSRSVEGEGNDVCDAACVGKTAKLRTVKLRQNSGDLSSYFVAIGSPIRTLPSLPVKAISIHGLSHKRFLILDSTGDLHLLSLCNPILASEATLATSESSKDACMMQLDYTMKVQMLAVLPDLSMRRQIIWISDAFHSVHIIQLADDVETNKDNGEKKLAHVSAMQAIFVSERIQDIVPLAANTVMILGQGDIFVYSIA